MLGPEWLVSFRRVRVSFQIQDSWELLGGGLVTWRWILKLGLGLGLGLEESGVSGGARGLGFEICGWDFGLDSLDWDLDFLVLGALRLRLSSQRRKRGGRNNYG